MLSVRAARHPFRHTSVALAVSVSVLFAEAQTPAPATPAAPTAPAAAPAAPAAPAAAPGAPKPFKEVIKDAKETAGFFSLYQKDEKVWIAIKPDQFNKPFFFTYNIPQSVGERGLYGSQMGGAEMAVFKKIGNHVQLIAKNAAFVAKAGTPQAQVVSEAFSDSLIASTAVASAPNADTKAILIEANSLLFSDIPGYLTRLESAYRMPFALDARNTSFSRINNTDSLTGLQVHAHFNVPKLNAPPLTPPPTPSPPPPSTVPDPRSLFVSFYYSFAKLPDEPMAPRLADERVGHFVSRVTDFTEDTSVQTKTHYVNRWRLEKKDAAAAVSEPKRPITFWLDKNIPQKYRKAVEGGILEWNKAFERVGFKNAIVAKQQTEQDDFDTMDAGHASVRWFVGADVGFAIGPSHKDPRTGEILDADIGMSDVFARGARRMVAEDIGKPHVFDAGHHGAMSHSLGQQNLFMQCGYMAEKAHDMHFALDLLDARGMDSAEAETVAQAYVFDVIMHEVGHTLGFRHNFRSSTIYSVKQIQDPAFTKVNGLAGSVMDYNPFNLATKGEKQGEYVMSTLGPYDYLAVEYAYKPLNPATEKQDLAAIAAKATTDPLLAYATDEDAGFGNLFFGIDPDVSRFDMGTDPLEYYKKSMTLSRELWDRVQNLQLQPGESYERLTRSFASGFRSYARTAPLVAKYVGGVKHLRDRAGTNRALYEPTPAPRQREALQLLTDGLFRADSFKFRPEFISRISIDHFDRRAANPDISVGNSVMNLQRSVLDVLMADQVAQRLIDSQEKVANPGALFKLSELYSTLQSAIWSELKNGSDISAMRRNLQRDHVKRIAGALLRPTGTTPADAKSLQRENAKTLAAAIRATAAKPMSVEARAHLNESLNTLDEALKANMQRAGV